VVKLNIALNTMVCNVNCCFLKLVGSESPTNRIDELASLVDEGVSRVMD